MKKLNISIILMLLFSAASDELLSQVWEKVEGTNPFINRIYSQQGQPERIIVSSDAEGTDILLSEMQFPYIGIGCQASSDSGKTFNQYFLTGMPVYDVYASKMNPNKWVAAVRKFNRGGILHSSDGGSNWNDFLSCDGVSQIWRITSSILDGNEFFALGAVQTSQGFIYSSDGLSSCDVGTSITIEARDIAYSKVMPNLLFIAGDSYSSGRVLRSFDNGQNWHKETNGLDGLRILSILPSSINPAIVLCGADSLALDRSSIGKGVFISLDTGKTWRNVGGSGAQVFQIVEHPRFPKFVAAAAGVQGVLVSSVYGRWFESYNTGLPQGKSVRQVLIPDWDTTAAGCITFAGVWGEGLFRSRHITSDVQSNYTIDDNFAFVSISPQPANDFVNIIWNNPIGQSASIKIFDSFGREVYSIDNAYFNSGLNTFNWNISSNHYPTGLYFIEISSQSGRIYNKIMKF